jgi:hypothetical protein
LKSENTTLMLTFLEPHQWHHQAPQDSVPQQMLQDSVKPQGALDELGKGAYQLGWISLDHVDGLTAEGELARNQTITFYLRVFNWWNIVDGLTNGFRIYSPDGAQWNTTSADTLPLGWEEMFDTYFTIHSYSADGEDADTVGYFAMATYPGGMPLMFDEVAFTVSIGPIGDEYASKTICLDSSFFGGYGYWLWSGCGGYCTYRPAWDGPHCFTVEPNQITFSGYLYYLDPAPPDTNETAMRHILIEMWDSDLFPNPDDSLAAVITEDDGWFVLGPVDNTDDVSGTQDIFFRIYAENEAADVTESHNGDIRKWQTPVGNDLPGGEYDTLVVAPLDSSGPFFIADVVLQAFEKWMAVANTTYPGIVEVVAEDGVGTWWAPSEPAIHIDMSDNALKGYPDTWDRDVIFHEYGHVIEWAFDFFDASSGGEHEWTDLVPPEFAATEAFAHFISSFFRDDSIQNNMYNNFTDTFWVNLENGEYGKNDVAYGSANHFPDREASVAGILWDIYDDVNDDYSIFGLPDYEWDPDTGYGQDSIGDTLSNGIDTILIVLLEKYVSGHHPDNIDEFWEAWFTNPALGHGQAMQDIWYEHGEIMHCCNTDGIRGDVDMGGSINVGDPAYLVAYLFGTPSGPAPPCFEEADVDASGSINTGDVAYLTAYLFGIPAGPLPPPCP